MLYLYVRRRTCVVRSYHLHVVACCSDVFIPVLIPIIMIPCSYSHMGVMYYQLLR